MLTWQAIASLPLLASLMGCYVMQPIGDTGRPSQEIVRLELNDAGRAAIGPLMGPEIQSIEGRFIDLQNETYTIGVRSVRRFTGELQRWSGETVHIKQEYIRSANERRLSTGRTVALSAVALGAVTAVVISLDIIGFGSPDPGIPRDTTVNPGSIRLP